ncbi:HAMP domain-containing sensor histidine kinase [Erythrobacter sp.]|uniref:sensor histidine kinase n=1 Tax=Erythrobacter sp. TaxID=1042 RepID=UPI0025F769A6|nr:HAMP domain-containing sensor histidine kinase [Erythrobacter sp.]
MVRAVKEWLKARWPRLRLRTILFATLFVVAALPGVAAMFLRVYENTLVRQTEAELVAQGAALAAVAAVQWPGGDRTRPDPQGFRPEPPTIDLSNSAILGERPQPQPTSLAPDSDAAAVAVTLAPITARTRQVTLSSIILLDRRGLIAAGPPGRSLAALPEVRAALAGQPQTVLRRNGDYRPTYNFEWLSRAAAVRVHHARPVIANGKVVGVVLLSRSARNLFKGLYADRGKIVLGIVGIFGLLIILSGVLSRGIVRPVEALARASRALASGRQDFPEPPRTAAVEIQELYAEFARMAEAIDRRSRYLRDFAHAVSHEFKTPLSGIRGTLEILGDHGDSMSPDERRRFLANADADAARLTMLSTRLLELARADLSANDPTAQSDLASIMKRLADAYWIDQFEVCSALPDNLPPLAIRATSLEAIASALIDNSRQAGATRVTFAARQEGAMLLITVADDGPGIAEADRTRMFEPFFTTRRAEGGSGLGLPIVKSLVEAGGGKLSLVNSEHGAEFALELPISA